MNRRGFLKCMVAGATVLAAPKIILAAPEKLIFNNIYYINHLKGSNLNNGLSPDKAFKTFERAISKSSYGDSVTFCGTGDNFWIKPSKAT